MYPRERLFRQPQVFTPLLDGTNVKLGTGSVFCLLGILTYAVDLPTMDSKGTRFEKIFL